MLQRLLVAEGPQGDLIDQEDDAICRHATIEQHVEHHATWLDTEREQVDLPRTPDELWQYADKWYPNLAFHPRVRAQLVNLGAASPAFGQVVEARGAAGLALRLEWRRRAGLECARYRRA